MIYIATPEFAPPDFFPPPYFSFTIAFPTKLPKTKMPPKTYKFDIGFGNNKKDKTIVTALRVFPTSTVTIPPNSLTKAM